MQPSNAENPYVRQAPDSYPPPVGVYTPPPPPPPNPTQGDIAASARAMLAQNGMTPVPAVNALPNMPPANSNAVALRNAVRNLKASGPIATAAQAATTPAAPAQTAMSAPATGTPPFLNNATAPAAASSTDPLAASLAKAAQAPAVAAPDAAANDPSLIQRMFPALTGNSQANTDIARAPGTLGATMGNQVRAMGNTLGDGLSDTVRPLQAVGGAIKNVASDFINSVVGNSAAPSSVAATTPATAPSNTTATQPAPAASTPAASAPTVAAAPPPDPNAAIFNAQNAYGKTVAPAIAAAFPDDGSATNAAIQTIRGSASARNAFNGVLSAQGTGATASLDSKGGLVLSGNGTPSNFQPSTQGFDLAGSNAKLAAALEANRQMDVNNSISDLAQRAASTGGKRGAALAAQAAALMGAQTAGKSAIADIALKGAQTDAEKLKTKLTANDAATLDKLQDQLVASKDPDERRAISEQILTLKGKDTKDAYQVAKGAAEFIDPNNPALGMKPAPDIVINTRSGAAQLASDAVKSGKVGTAAPGATATPTAANIARLQKNPSEAALFDAQFGPGASAKILAGKK